MNSLKLFSIYLFLIGLSAVFGGWVLIYTDWMNFPANILETTPFNSFIIPGLILALVYGGIQFLAAFLLWTKNRWMYGAAAAAGFCQLIWMVTEIYLIPDHQPIQVIYLILAIITLAWTMYLLKFQQIK